MNGAAGDNVELVRSGYEAWNRGDVEAIVAAFDDNVAWYGHPKLPEPGPYFGREAVQRWLSGLRGVWEEITIHPFALAESGESVVALVQIMGRGMGSGIEVESGIDAHVWKIEAGRVLEMRWLQGNVVADRLGLSPDEIRSADADTLAEKLPVLAEAECG